MRHLLPDTFTLALLATVVLATLLPMTGSAAHGLDRFTNWAIAALFFLHGARLPREAIVAGLLHWRLHLLILCCTFVLFPLTIKARPVAMIYADKDRPGELRISEQELAMLRTLRNQAVLAIKQAG